jgi:hypothetical protein
MLYQGVLLVWNAFLRLRPSKLVRPTVPVMVMVNVRVLSTFGLYVAITEYVEYSILVPAGMTLGFMHCKRIIIVNRAKEICNEWRNPKPKNGD